MKQVKALVLTGFGLNCDMETARAFELAGASAQRVHINALVNQRVDLDGFHILAFGGGFSWGDDHGAGVIQALKLKNHLGDKLLSFVEKGRLVMGICNGFQTLVNLGLLPGLEGDYTQRSVALTWNDCGNFRDQWVNLQGNQQSPCVFTPGMAAVELPVRHGEGKFVTDEKTLARLIDNNQVVFRYADKNNQPARGRFPMNPNGSMDDIAGICDPTGRIFGLMPHPEAFNHESNHPDWPRTKEILKRSGKEPDPGVTPGIQIFKNGVDYMRSKL
ncbi:PurQ [Desulforapulum autotrophicum HRM2]|uniref:PurQ n=1 Tax=Desulforapulum autotrophicum (strain ATCC 43914 / DSM 3382 / VKM B-1955 / HRM2) TaxID=177437 RepID=C0QB26_DESAH|nr:phosphoribosylformylglycinamidine synthase subunit PurQ [Desulforapulum autotrophicum]ACN14825.1 PurQ [Desulforapulum autotrophicum HRM2]